MSLDELSSEEWLLELGNVMGDKEYITATYANDSEEKVINLLYLVTNMCT